MTNDSAKALVLPLAVLVAFEVWARATHLQSDSLAPPSEIVMALIGAFADFSILTATRDTLFSAFTGLAIGTLIGLAFGCDLASFFFCAAGFLIVLSEEVGVPRARFVPRDIEHVLDHEVETIEGAARTPFEHDLGPGPAGR